MHLAKRLDGERVTLRRVRREDLPIFQQWLNCGATSAYLDSKFTFGLTIDDEAAFYDLLSRSAEFIAASVCRLDDDVMIGISSLDFIDHFSMTAELGVIVAAPFQGHGLGADASRTMIRHAFEELGMRRLYTKTSILNRRALAHHTAGLGEGIGAVPEGVLREHRFHEGRYYDEVVMGLTREDYRRFYVAGRR